MAKKEPYSLIFAPVVHSHLAAIDAKHDSLIRQKIEEQLTHDPDVETRNRKPVQAPAAFMRNGSCGSAQITGSAFFIKSTARIGRYESLPSG